MEVSKGRRDGDSHMGFVSRAHMYFRDGNARQALPFRKLKGKSVKFIGNLREHGWESWQQVAGHSHH